MCFRTRVRGLRGGPRRIEGEEEQAAAAQLGNCPSFPNLPSPPPTPDPEYANNLAFFLRHGVAPHAADGAKLVVVIQADNASAPDPPRVAAALAHAPPGVVLLRRNNSCYDWGAFGWLLAQPEAAPPVGRAWRGGGRRAHGGRTAPATSPAAYHYYVLLNSSVRCPFLPHSVPVHTPWHRLLTRRLGGGGSVRAVGPVVSCEPSPWRGDALHGPWRSNPHIQSWLLALDAVGLATLLADGSPLACARDRWDAVRHGELGASAALLAAGHNLGCLLPRYAGVDWRDPAAAACNQRVSPVGDGFFDGATLAPSDTLFVKVKARLLAARHPATLAAVKLGEWADGRLLTGCADISSNAFVNDPATHKLPRVAAMRARGATCFDAPYYKAANPDLAHLDDGAAWAHAVASGQFETRDMRFLCSAAALPPTLVAERDRLHAHGHGPPREGAPRPRVVGASVW